MKRTVLILLMFVYATTVFAQTDSLTMRDDVRFKYQIKKAVMRNYEQLLNFIADNTNASNEIDAAIDLRVNGGKEIRLFAGTKVIVENDLKTGADTNKVLRPDQEVMQYLKNFYTNYTKTENKSVFLNVVDISPLKLTTYYYYNVLFECNYSSTNTSGEHFKPFNRVAEIKLVNDSGWHLYINGVRFASDLATDTVNAYRYLIPADTSMEGILKAYDNEEERKLQVQKVKLELLIDEGNDKFITGDFEGALAKFREARVLNTEDKEAKVEVEKARNALKKKKLEEQQKAEREKHINEMKIEARKQNDNFNFKLSKTLCDSLTQDFGVTDADIVLIGSELSLINAAIERINNTVDKGDYQGAIKLCGEKKLEVKNLVYRSQFYYQEAIIYSKFPKPDQNKISENLNQAIELSGKRHREALMMRARMRADKNDMNGAIEDATVAVNNDSRNPDNYNFRGVIYERDKQPNKAIEDYASAIANKSNDPIVYLKKARLEYATQKYSDAKKTASVGIDLNKCNGMLNFYRALAEVKTNDFENAGKDFRAAIYCGINDSSKTAIKTVSNLYVTNGDTALAQKKTDKAITEFSKAILIDSSANALYKRAKCFIAKEKNDSALVDLNLLIRRTSNYYDAHSQRGMVYTNLQRFADANKDFEFETKNFSDSAAAFYVKGSSELIQKNYKTALSSFETAALHDPSESVYYMASLAAYSDKNYNRAIELSNKARNKHTTRSDIFYICGRAFYDAGKFDEAVKEFAKAKPLAQSNSDEITFWFAAALESDKQFMDAATSYESTLATSKYKDTVLYRSAICYIKSGEEKSFTKAIDKLNQYLRADTAADSKSSVCGWKAFTYLKLDLLPQVEQAIEEGKRYNDKNAMLQLAQACRNIKLKMNENAYSFLENALASKQFTKTDIEDEKLLRPIMKTEKVKSLLQKYFP